MKYKFIGFDGHYGGDEYERLFCKKLSGLSKNISLRSYYLYLGYLTQEPSVFDGSIKDNLLYSLKRKVSEMGTR